MEVHSSVSSWWVPPAISLRAWASVASADRSASSSAGSGCLRFRFDFEFALFACEEEDEEEGGGLPKPICVGGALRRPVSTLASARSARKLMLLMISSSSDCVLLIYLALVRYNAFDQTETKQDEIKKLLTTGG